MTVMGRVWPLIGRLEERRLIDAAMARSSGLHGVVIAGPAGVGKTRLALETLAAATRHHRLTRWVTATSSARHLPLGAFAGVWRGGSGGDPLLVLRAAMDALLDGAGDAGVVVGVDDAHLLDDHSAFLVHQLVLQDAARVVLTVRTREPAPASITSLWKDGRLSRLELQPLSTAETAELLSAVLGGHVQEESAHRMWSLTGGNILYVRHILDEEIKAGRWRLDDGTWLWFGMPAVSSGLAELITAQMGELSESVHEVVDLLAMAEPLDVSLLARLVDPVAVEMAESAGLVAVADREGELEARLSHPLYGEVRRSRTGQLRARRLRGLIARDLAQHGLGHAERPERTVRRAVLSLDSDLPPDPEIFAGGALAAFALLDMSLAERLLDAAVQAGAGFDAEVARAYALTVLSRGRDAEALLSRLTEHATGDIAAVRVAGLRAANLFWDLGSPAEAEAVLDRAETLISTTDAFDVLVALRSLFSSLQGRGQQGVVGATRVLAAQLPSDQVTLIAMWGLVVGLGGLGRSEEADAVAARGYALAERSFDAAFLRFGLCDFHLLALRLAGQVNRAHDVAVRLRNSTAEVAGPPQLFTAALMGHAAVGVGDLPAAIRWLRQALAGLVVINEMAGWRFHTLLSLVQALGMSGDGVGASRAMVELEACWTPAVRFLDAHVLIARAWIAAAQGVVSEAQRLAGAAADRAAAQGQPAFEVLALHAGVRFGDRTSTARLTALADLVDGPRAAAAAAHSGALSADDGDALDAASRQVEEMGDRLAAADAAAHAATVHARHGRRGSALSATARAQRLAAACGGALTPALREASLPSPLSTREREIVALAAQGLSNRAIAERLVLSVRTVEGHLYRATTKLGGASRGELGEYLTTHRTPDRTAD